MIDENFNTQKGKGRNSKTSSHQDSKTSKRQTAHKKVTVYLDVDDIICLEELRLILKRQGHDIDKSELIREAIKLLAKRYKGAEELAEWFKPRGKY